MQYMHTNHTPKLGTNDVEARWSSETLIENLSEAVGATSPMSGNYAPEGDVTTHDNDTVSVPNVTPEKRARVSLTCDDETPTEKNMTADDYMKKHIGETKPTNMFTSITNTNDNEFNNDDYIYESLIDNGHTHEEASSVLYNFYHYGSPYSPDEIDSIHAMLNEPIGEDVMKIAREFAKTTATNCSEESNF